jgi:hypothetical protein
MARLVVAGMLVVLAPLVFPPVASASPQLAITSASSAEFIAGQVNAFTVTTTSTQAPALTEVGALPAGVTFVDNGNATATLAGTPGTAGTYPLTLTASNAAGRIATQTFILSVGQGWYNTNWLYRKQLTIDFTKVGGPLTNFPVLVNRTDAALITKAQSDGDDILFTDSDGTTKLNHEIESFTPGTGALVAWVNVPALSSTANTVIYLYYGYASATNQQNATAVWDTNYKGVWHLKENPAGTQPAMKDSTSNASNGTANGTMTSGQQIPGLIDGSLDFDGSNDRVVTTDIGDNASALTFEFWVKLDALTGTVVPMAKSNTPTASPSFVWALSLASAQLEFFLATGGGSTTSVTYAAGPALSTWYQFVAVYSGSAMGIYSSGVLRTSVAKSGTINNTADPVVLGNVDDNVAHSYWVNGMMDEARVSNVARSANWILTQYNNQNSPSTFMAVAAEEALTAPAITSANSTTFTGGQPGTFTVTTTGTPAPTVTKTGTLPTGVTFVDNGDGTATLAGTSATSGSYPLTITAHNVASPDATQSFTLTVTQVWYGSSWLYRKAITVDHTKVPADTGLFSVLVSRTDADLAAHAQSSGNDIVFTSSDMTTKLPHEIESYTSGTGVLVAWVQAPVLSSTVDTTLYMYYGNAAAANQQNVTGTWRSEFTGVWHLSQSPTATAPQFKDSTGNANHGTNQGSIPVGAQVPGQIDGSLTLDGNANYISTAVQQTNPQAFSVEAWVKTTTGAGKAIVNFEGPQTGTSNPSGLYDRSLYIGIDGKPRFVVWDGSAAHVAAGGATITDGQWHHVLGSYNGSAAILYVDGNVIVSVASASAQSFNGYWRIGSFHEAPYASGADGYFLGSVDEVRVANVPWAATTITARYNNQSSPSTFITVAAEQAFSLAWYNPSWSYRKKITLTASQISGPLTDFPVLISTTDAALITKAQSTGNDILFTSDDGVTKLKHEVEKYTNTTGLLIAWVKMPTLSATTNVLYLYYGNAAAAAQADPANTWNTGFAAVYHLKENPTNPGSSEIKDSTGNGRHGSSNGAMTSANQVTGQVDGSVDFDGTDDKVITADYADGTGVAQLSLSTWVYIDVVTNGRLIAKTTTSSNTAANDWSFALGIDTAGVARASIGTASNGGVPIELTVTTALTLSTWMYFTMSYDGANIRLYKNGALIGTLAQTGTITNITPKVALGEYDGAGTGRYLNGRLDEARVATTARSTGWFLTEYNNQSSPSGFTAFATEETSLIAPGITSANSTTFTAGAAGTFTVTATGTPTPTVTKTGTLPTGVTFVDNSNGSATLAGTPTTSGSYPLTITAHNTATPDATQSFTLTVSAGSLTISLSGSPSLGSGTLGTTISGALGSVQVLDNRGSATASWTASVSSSTFTSGGATVPLANIKYWSGPSTATTGAGTFTPGQAAVGAAQTLTTSRTAFTLAGGNSTNSATWNPTLVVAIPITLVPGIYTATVTHSVV